MERFEKIPVPAVATCLASLTLGNVYGGLGYTWLRTLIMICGTVLIAAYIVKIVRFPKTCLAEYNEVIPCSLYAAFPMCLMILGSFYFEKGLVFGKGIWWAGVAIHFVHILVFTVKHVFGNVIAKKNYMPMMPSWFVTYNGWMVACVTGGAMNAAWILKIITVYGCIIYPLVLVFMIWRLRTMPIKKETYHTLCVLLAPVGFCVVAPVNVFEHPNVVLMYVMYAAFLVTLVFLLTRFPRFFSYDFYPGYAGLTFPMSLGVVASQKMAAYLTANGHEALAGACLQLSGLQILIASMVVGYCVIMFVRLLLKTEKVS